MALRWPFKDPDEILDYYVDWTRRLYSESELEQSDAGETVVPADTISTSTFTLPAGITANSSSNTTTVSQLWLSGGSIGQTYAILNEIVTAGGRRMDQTIRIRVNTK